MKIPHCRIRSSFQKFPFPSPLVTPFSASHLRSRFSHKPDFLLTRFEEDATWAHCQQPYSTSPSTPNTNTPPATKSSPSHSILHTSATPAVTPSRIDPNNAHTSSLAPSTLSSPPSKCARDNDDGNSSTRAWFDREEGTYPPSTPSPLRCRRILDCVTLSMRQREACDGKHGSNFPILSSFSGFYRARV